MSEHYQQSNYLYTQVSDSVVLNSGSTVTVRLSGFTSSVDFFSGKIFAVAHFHNMFSWKVTAIIIKEAEYYG